MTNRSSATRAVTLGLITLAALVAPIETTAAADYQKLLTSQGARAAVQPILAAFENQGIENEIERLAKILATSPKDAAAVFDTLAAEESVQAASLSAELLYDIANRIGGRPLIDDPAWQLVAERGTACSGMTIHSYAASPRGLS